MTSIDTLAITSQIKEAADRWLNGACDFDMRGAPISRRQAGWTVNIVDFAAGYHAALLSRSPQAVQEPASVRMLTEGDMTALQRIAETFEDGQGWDITKDQMARLADLGAVRWHGASRYSITAFGRMALSEDFSRWPLETVEECNARLAAANNLTVKD